MDDQFERHAEVLKKLLEDGDTTFWIVWSDIVEKSFMVGLQIGEGKYSSHGIFRTTEKKVHSPVFDAACLLTLLEHNPKADPRQRKSGWRSMSRTWAR